jgi:hypothetical protein
MFSDVGESFPDSNRHREMIYFLYIAMEVGCKEQPLLATCYAYSFV